MLPETDEQGRFKPVLRNGSMIRRAAAKLIDAVIGGFTTWTFSRFMPLPFASLVGVGWFLATDWSGSPGKWLLRLKTVNLEGGEVSLIASLKRNVILGLPTLARAFLVSGWVGLQGENMVWDRGFLACVGLSIFAGELFGMFTHPEARRWGDLFARTRVVERG
ncbi:MAG TPA: RDD family protein [Archangium sp.]